MNAPSQAPTDSVEALVTYQLLHLIRGSPNRPFPTINQTTTMAPYILRENALKDDDTWVFTVPQNDLQIPANRSGIYGKLITFTRNTETSTTTITLQMQKFPENRIIRSDDASKFILISFGMNLRWPETTFRATAEYISRMMKAGLFLNGVQYRFYHHSNSQLRGRSCFMRHANTDAELDDRIYQLGDFGRIMNIAKRAKRIGLLFSEAQLDWQLDPQWVADIPDIKSGDELFSDGCGLISQRLAVQLSKARRIIFRGTRYTPTVFQIRYLGYKGVLMLHPQLDVVDKKHLIHFRKSMKKFSTTTDHTFSIVAYSKPYSFGRLNNDVIVLLSSLGITNEKLLAKQAHYFQWILEASKDSIKAFDLLSAIGEYDLAEKVLLDGLDDPEVSRKINRIQLLEISKFKNDRGKGKSRIFVRDSRRLFGVCDPFQVLKEGEVQIRVTAARKGQSTLIHGDVLVVKNPCLHPGDCLKLRAAHHEKLSHLVDCVVFASVARPGHRSAPSMSSGGDLDGDDYFVCWDPDLVPSRVVESYDYPGNKEHISKEMKRSDLANHFASYSGASVARVAALHARWVRSSPKGALSPECQELNALHSQSVDGANIKIPDRLKTPPETQEKYIVDLLEEEAKIFAENFTQSESARGVITSTDAEDGKALLVQLLQNEHSAVSEYELFNLACKIARKHSFDVRPFLSHIDMSALSSQEKIALSLTVGFSPEEQGQVWNSLIRSDILTPRDIYQRALDRPFAIQRLYSSKIHGLSTFFEYLSMAMQDYTRKLLIMKTEDRFAVGIFMKGEIPWDVDPDPEVDKNVVVCSFMPHTSSTLSGLRPCTPGYRLHCSDTNFQLYNKHIGDTFVFINRPPRQSTSEVTTSIALQKISTTVQRQIGRINKTPVTVIELHVVSNRDRVAHQLFDLWFEHVPTEEYVKRFERQAAPYKLNDLENIDWTDPEYPDWLELSFFPKLHNQAQPHDNLPGHADPWPMVNLAEKRKVSTERHTAETMHIHLSKRTALEIERIMNFALKYHAEDELFLIFNFVITREPRDLEIVKAWLDRFPPLAFALLKAFPPRDDGTLSEEVAQLGHHIIRNIIRAANSLKIAVLVALEKISGTVASLPVDQYFDLLMLAALSVRSQQLVQEVLLVLNDCRLNAGQDTVAVKYGCKFAVSIAFDRAEEAADECPCNDEGRPRKQRTPPTHVRLRAVIDHPDQVKAMVRVDARTAVRLHSHVRLQATSKATNRWIEAPILDGVVVLALKGELKIDLLHPPPPEMEEMDWNMYNAGSIATSKAMMDAMLRLLQEGAACCRFHRIITGDRTQEDDDPTVDNTILDVNLEQISDHLNASQILAVESCRVPLSLIWGPPGTGKTTVVIQILRHILTSVSGELPKILMTASTHNAVDNVLERFVELNKEEKLLAEQQVLRVATDQTKVNDALKHYTIDARIGGDMNENNRLVKQAEERVKSAILVFTTCAGAGLGILRKVNYDIAIIDEASQITEPVALIPLVKGIQRAVLVGDHVQLRPTVRKMGKALEFDISLLERLYTHIQAPEMRKTMLDMQYRSPGELMAFPSREFYENRLQTGREDTAKILDVLTAAVFPWPSRDGVVVPTIFIPCSSEEDMGGMSKSNAGQVDLVEYILPMLTTKKDESDPQAESPLEKLKITVLSPYTKQIHALRHRLPSSVSCSTVDSFQGRESDIVIFSAVRCNAEGDIGFLDDARRLNVMWTRARLALIIVGDRRTMNGNLLWKRALDSCTEVTVKLPEAAG